MEITIHDINDIQRAAQTFIENMPQGNVLAFYGNMGVGKTTFIKALCRELGVEEEVTSPTFAIVNEYEIKEKSKGENGKLPTAIYHFDFYRIKKLEEVYDMGYEDYFYSNGLCLIEWPELIEEVLPDDATKVYITEQKDGSRLVTF
ncbi:MAG: tRNA (adenosine(37)-N6)-threonylcarbamoyltransferase complex ATPase subunit type 1 TsaE [Prevotella sp.]|nr:tRNA (adenosine(37)-N6)-threonylcarbamoyltransferase complex ATPase subunit type 1 TsaE [Prevotella sp.]